MHPIMFVSLLNDLLSVFLVSGLWLRRIFLKNAVFIHLTITGICTHSQKKTINEKQNLRNFVKDEYNEKNHEFRLKGGVDNVQQRDQSIIWMRFRQKC
jgi:hypothetical protein